MGYVKKYVKRNALNVYKSTIVQKNIKFKVGRLIKSNVKSYVNSKIKLKMKIKKRILKRLMKIKLIRKSKSL